MKVPPDARNYVLSEVYCIACAVEKQPRTPADAWVTLSCGKHTAATCAKHAYMHMKNVKPLICAACARA